MKHLVTSPRILMLLENSRFPEDRRVTLKAQSLVEAGFKVTVIGLIMMWPPSIHPFKMIRYRPWNKRSFGEQQATVF
jgi:hypothetical protein